MAYLEIGLAYIKQNWVFIFIALIVLFVVMSFIKTIVKWGIVIVFIAAIAVHCGMTGQDVLHVMEVVKGETVEKLKDQALNVMVEEAQQAKFSYHEDGTYTVTSTAIKLQGKGNSETVVISCKGISLGEWKINDTVRQFIRTAKQNQ